MEDRYLFKAKRLNNGEWVTGSLITCEDGTCKIATSCLEGKADEPILVCAYDVDRDTICQCTGLKDKKGKLIWANDILHNGNYFVVKWNAPCARFDIVLNNSHNIPIGKWEPMICDWKTNDFKEYRKSVDYEVIGNVFDNKELLESEE